MIRYLTTVVLSFLPRTAIMILGLRTVQSRGPVRGGIRLATAQTSTVFIIVASTLHMQMVSTGLPGKDTTILLKELK